MKKIYFVLFLIVILLSGCGPFQESTKLKDDEEQAVVTYCADTVLKHTRSNKAVILGRDSINAYLEKKKLLEENKKEQNSKEDKNTDEKNLTADESSLDNSNKKTEVEQKNSKTFTMQEILGLSNIDIKYNNYEVTDSYTSEVFTLNPSKGTLLVILKFTLANNNAEDVAVNLASKQASYTVTVNGDTTKDALLSILPNDLITFNTTIPANSTKAGELVFEIPEDTAKAIKDISLSASVEKKSGKIKLD